MKQEDEIIAALTEKYQHVAERISAEVERVAVVAQSKGDAIEMINRVIRDVWIDSIRIMLADDIARDVQEAWTALLTRERATAEECLKIMVL